MSGPDGSSIKDPHMPGSRDLAVDFGNVYDMRSIQRCMVYFRFKQIFYIDNKGLGYET